MLKALVLANGDLYRPGILRRRIRDCQFDLVLGADWGSRHARSLGVALNAIIGDLDSIPDQERQNYSQVKFITYPEEKDETDLELALLYSLKQGAGYIVMVGVMGGRMDMAIANILVMNHPALSACRMEVWHGNQTGWIIRPPGEDIRGCSGDTVSLIALSNEVTNIDLKGFKYPLRKEKLMLGQGRGLSNQLANASARVEFSEGLLLAVRTPGRA
jgi:thiamine pyrophosphokinase